VLSRRVATGTLVEDGMQHGDDSWRSKVLDGRTAIKWALKIADEDDRDAIWFLRCVNDDSVLKDPEWSEYRYWATGVHEPDNETEPAT
jgi:hypothetical protein